MKVATCKTCEYCVMRDDSCIAMKRRPYAWCKKNLLRCSDVHPVWCKGYGGGPKFKGNKEAST